jgi:hypothetical protein
MYPEVELSILVQVGVWGGGISSFIFPHLRTYTTDNVHLRLSIFTLDNQCLFLSFTPVCTAVATLDIRYLGDVFSMENETA